MRERVAVERDDKLRHVRHFHSVHNIDSSFGVDERYAQTSRTALSELTRAECKKAYILYGIIADKIHLRRADGQAWQIRKEDMRARFLSLGHSSNAFDVAWEILIRRGYLLMVRVPFVDNGKVLKNKFDYLYKLYNKPNINFDGCVTCTVEGKITRIGNEAVGEEYNGVLPEDMLQLLRERLAFGKTLETSLAEAIDESKIPEEADGVEFSAEIEDYVIADDNGEVVFEDSFASSHEKADAFGRAILSLKKAVDYDKLQTLIKRGKTQYIVDFSVAQILLLPFFRAKKDGKWSDNVSGVNLSLGIATYYSQSGLFDVANRYSELVSFVKADADLYTPKNYNLLKTFVLRSFYRLL